MLSLIQRKKYHGRLDKVYLLLQIKLGENLTSVLDNVMLLLQIKLGKGDWIMERKEILKRAQDEKLDERELQVKDKSMMWSYIVMVIMAIVRFCMGH